MKDDTKSRLSAFPQYDIIAYFVPGSTFLLLSVMFESSIMSDARDSETDFQITYYVHELIDSIRFQIEGSYISTAIEAFVFALGSYVIGMIISTIASVLIERGFIGRNNRYPFLIFFNPRDKRNRLDSPRRGLMHEDGAIPALFIFSIFTISTTSLLAYNHIALKYISGASVIILFFGFILFHIMKTGRDKHSESSLIERIWIYILLIIAYIPLVVISEMIKSLSLDKPVSTSVIKRFKEIYKERTGIEFDPTHTDSFWISYAIARTHGNFSSSYILYALRSYRLARNISFSLILNFSYCGILSGIVIMKNYYSLEELSNLIDADIIAYVIFFLVSSFLFFIRFITMYYNTFSRNIVRFIIS